MPLEEDIIEEHDDDDYIEPLEDQPAGAQRRDQIAREYFWRYQ